MKAIPEMPSTAIFSLLKLKKKQKITKFRIRHLSVFLVFCRMRRREVRIIFFENNFKHLCDDVKSDNIRCHKEEQRESEGERVNSCNMS